MLLCSHNVIFEWSHNGPVMDEAMQLSDRIGCRMKLHDLHVLMAVVQAGSMSKAAAPSVDDVAIGEHRSAAGDDEIAFGLEVVSDASRRSARRKSCHRAPARLGLRGRATTAAGRCRRGWRSCVTSMN